MDIRTHSERRSSNPGIHKLSLQRLSPFSTVMWRTARIIVAVIVY